MSTAKKGNKAPRGSWIFFLHISMTTWRWMLPKKWDWKSFEQRKRWLSREIVGKVQRRWWKWARLALSRVVRGETAKGSAPTFPFIGKAVAVLTLTSFALFFRLPRSHISSFPLRQPEKLKTWLEAIGLDNAIVNAHHRICSNHFSPSDFYLIHPSNKKVMKDRAVPSLNLEVPEVVEILHVFFFFFGKVHSFFVSIFQAQGGTHKGRADSASTSFSLLRVKCVVLLITILSQFCLSLG